MKEIDMKKVAESFGFAVIILLMMAAVLTFLAPHFGWSVDAVYSGSMEPELKVGGVAVSRPVEAEDIKVGDTIIFHSPLSEKLTSHRVIAVEHGSGPYFLTKGDANGHRDPFTVPAENVEGKVCFHIPYLGYVAQFVKSPLGLLLTLCLPGLIIIVMELRNIWCVLTEDEIERKYRIKYTDER
jgi:signal peptidase